MAELLELARDLLSAHGAVVELVEGTATPGAIAERAAAAPGAIVEVDGAHAARRAELEALLPPELARRLELPEEARLREDLAAGATRLAYGSETLERLLSLAGERAVVARAHLTEPPPASSDPVAAALGQVTGLNCVLRPPREEGPVEGWAGYLVLDYRYVADADERREGLVRVGLAEQSGAPLAALERLDGHPRLAPGFVSPPPLPPDPAALLARAERVARAAVDRQLAPIVATVGRRHDRDRARLARYFGELREEMTRQLRRRGRGDGDADQERAARQAKIDALDGELSRKLADLQQRYRLRVEVTPIAALRLGARVRRVPLLARRRRAEGRLEVCHSAVTGGFEPLCCQACGASVYALSLCDERLHLLCGDCDRARPSARACPVCSGGRRVAGLAVPGAR